MNFPENEFVYQSCNKNRLFYIAICGKQENCHLQKKIECDLSADKLQSIDEKLKEICQIMTATFFFTSISRVVTERFAVLFHFFFISINRPMREKCD